MAATRALLLVRSPRRRKAADSRRNKEPAVGQWRRRRPPHRTWALGTCTRTQLHQRLQRRFTSNNSERQ